MSRRRELVTSLQPVANGISCIGNYNPRSGIGHAASENARIIETILPVERLLAGPGKYKLHYYHGMPQEEPHSWVKDRPTAAYWMVETSKIHPDWRKSADSFAEIWTGSEASKSSILSCGTTTHVHVVPHVVPVPTRQARERGDVFRFFTAMAPPTSRKNPEGVIKAFKKAFPISRYRKSVELIFKFRTPEHTFRHLMKCLADGDPRITFLFDEMTRDELEGWYANSDAYVSLQRGGAFELHCAEAASYGLPIVTTEVGGVLDYLSKKFAHLVPGVEVPFDGEHKVNSGGVWIEPDIGLASEAMKMLFEMEEAERSYIRGYSRAIIADKLSEQRVTEIFRERIAHLLTL